MSNMESEAGLMSSACIFYANVMDRIIIASFEELTEVCGEY